MGRSTPRRAVSEMRVLIILPKAYGPPWNEGQKNLARSLVEFLRQRGDSVCVAGANGITYPEEPRETDGSNDAKQIPDRFALLRTVRQAAKLFRPDVSLLFCSCSSLLGVKTRLLRSILPSPLVLYVSGLRAPVCGYKLLLKAHKILVGSPFLREYFPHAPLVFPFTKPELTNASAVDKFPNGQQKRRPARKFLFLGAWEPGRGIEDLLQATAIARIQVPVELIVAFNDYGRNDLQFFRQMTKRIGIDEAVDVRGTVNVRDVYREADVVVIPRNKPYRMAFPLRIIESLCMGTPLITTTMCHMHELIEGCGLAGEPNDPQSLADAMVRMATDAPLYQRCRKNCAAKAKEYDSQRSLSRFHDELQPTL